MLNTQTFENYNKAFDHIHPLPDHCCESTLEQLQHTSQVVLTSNPCPCYLETMHTFKPKGILGTRDNNLEQALHTLLRGERYYSPMLYKSPLTEKERHVLHCNAKGLEIKEIATLLHCEPCTIQTHMKRIYEKLRLAFPNLKLANTRHLLLYWRGEWHLLQK